MNKKKIAAKVTTGLFALAMLPGAAMNIVQPDVAVEMASILGLPLHLLTLIGIWKLLGVAVLVTPRFERLKEWAYAGFFFDLTGAAFLHAAVGDVAGVPVPLLLVVLLVASYVLRNASSESVSTPALTLAISA